MGADDFAGDGEAEPVTFAAVVGFGGAGAAVEAFEEVGEVFLGDAGAGVADGDLEGAGLEVAGGDADGAAGRGVAKGVVEEVVHDLFEAFEVAADFGGAGGGEFEANGLFFGT